MLETGYKFCFDHKFQRLKELEVFVRSNKTKYYLPDLILGPQQPDSVAADLSIYSEITF
jgi:hypothetical protein